jgi:NADH dehydrogenase
MLLSKKPKIIVVGAGFAGMRAVKKLARSNAEIILIDLNNYHTFVPLLYQVATGFIAPETITYPIRKFARSYKYVRFIQARVESVDFDSQIVKTSTFDLYYDYLVLATGSKAQFLGVDGAAEFALPMRTLTDAVAIHHRLISNFEQASICNDLERITQLLTFVIVGGGATGVELAGSIQEFTKVTLAKDYSALDFRQVRIVLVHSGTTLLQDYPEQLSKYTFKQLRRRGVRIHLRSRVSRVFPEAIELDDGTKIEAAAVIWTAGVEAAPPGDTKEEISTADKDKVCVKPTLQLPNYPQVYAVGDVAFVKQNGEPLLGIAPEALQQGDTVAHNLRRQLRGLSPEPFNYFNKGKAAIVARNSGVAYLFGRIPLKGFLAWLMWLLIHLYYLPGIANRFVVLGSWIRDYTLKERNLRQLFTHRHVSRIKD